MTAREHEVLKGRISSVRALKSDPDLIGFTGPDGRPAILSAWNTMVRLANKLADSAELLLREFAPAPEQARTALASPGGTTERRPKSTGHEQGDQEAGLTTTLKNGTLRGSASRAVRAPGGAQP